jgi:prepilin-type processing-associated H-X9-DG protein
VRPEAPAAVRRAAHRYGLPDQPGRLRLRPSFRHPGGVNVLYMDGRVQFTSDAIHLGVWRAISTRSGKEMVALSGQ